MANKAKGLILVSSVQHFLLFSCLASHILTVRDVKFPAVLSQNGYWSSTAILILSNMNHELSVAQCFR